MKLSLYQKLAVLIVVLQGTFFAVWSVSESKKLAAGRAIIVKPVPVDPRDLLRGQYFTLAYDFSSMRKEQLNGDTAAITAGVTVFATLKPQNGVYVLDNFSTWPQEESGGNVVLSGTIERCRGTFTQSGSCQITYGIERYFVHEGTAAPDLAKTTIALRVSADHSVRIETLLVDGKPYP